MKFFKLLLAGGVLLLIVLWFVGVIGSMVGVNPFALIGSPIAFGLVLMAIVCAIAVFISSSFGHHK